MRYRGVARAQQRAREAGANRRQWERAHTDEPATLNDSEISGAIYRLQSERRAENMERMGLLLAEQQRRREAK